MELRFESGQPHQRRALDAVVSVLRGARFVPPQACSSSLDGISVVRNELTLSLDTMDHNARDLQRRAGLPTDGVRFESVEGGSTVPHVSVEMETGTGKTYVFLRTALELSARFGLRKFIVVVPSIAVKEGVLATLRATRSHFRGLYPNLAYRWFGYERGQVGQILRFARSAGTEFAVMTIDAFNRSSNVFRRPQDRFGGLSPLALWRHARPVLILDEPHHLETSLRVQALADLRPCLAIRYGATHRDLAGLVHRLSPAAAHASGLVKTIEVAGVAGRGDRPEDRFSAQLAATMEAHLGRRRELAPAEIKVLSLVFLDRVRDYADLDGCVRRAFARHFERLKGSDPGWSRLRPEQVCAAYFAQDRRRGRAVVDSRGGQSVADLDAYRLILADRERLLDPREPVSFVFSHSALREGWDNPNIFQICTLAHSRSAVRKRQEIGRGIRLCVDARGRRVTDPEVNVLRVFTNESYADYVAALQTEWDTDTEREHQAPLPRPVDSGSRSTRRVTSVGRGRDALPPEDWWERARASLAGLPPEPEQAEVPVPVEAEPTFIDRVVAGLDADAEGLPVSRRSLLALLEAVPHAERMLGAPSRWVGPWVEAIRAARRPTGGEGR